MAIRMTGIKDNLFFRYKTKDYVPDRRAVLEFDNQEDCDKFKRWFHNAGKEQFREWLKDNE